MKYLLFLLISSSHCFSQTISEAHKKVRRQSEFSFETFNLKPVDPIESWHISTGCPEKNTCILNDSVVFQLKKISQSDSLILTETTRFGDSSGVFFDAMSIDYFKFNDIPYYDMVMIPFNAASASRQDCIHVLFNAEKKPITSFKSATETNQCIGDFDNDGKLDFMLFCWECDLDYVYIYNILYSDEIHKNDQYKIGLIYNFNKYYYPLINRKTTIITY